MIDREHSFNIKLPIDSVTGKYRHLFVLLIGNTEGIGQISFLVRKLYQNSPSHFSYSLDYGSEKIVAKNIV